MRGWEEKKSDFNRMWNAAEEYKGSRSFQTLKKLARSDDPNERLLSLLIIRHWRTQSHRQHFDLARSMVGDTDNHCRWQALIVVGEYLDSRTEDVWDVIDENAASADEDMQTAIFCLLLEHLWELNRREYRKNARRLAKKHAWLEDCVDDDAMWFIRGKSPPIGTNAPKRKRNTTRTRK
jgi:hypothetical protein